MRDHALQRLKAPRRALAPEVEDDDEGVAEPIGFVQRRTPGVGTSALGALMRAGGNLEAVQLLGGGGDEEPASVRAAAADGVAGSGGRLPHLDAIQASFGSHDVSGIGAHVGGRAAGAAEAIGATAYATGDQVAFAQRPDLHTAAHEAAHVVQQRAGVSLYGGVGRAGDAYEQQADAVADRVVAGRSAEDLLGPARGAGGGVQMRAVQREEVPDAAQERDRDGEGAEGPGLVDRLTPKVTIGDGVSVAGKVEIPLWGPVKAVISAQGSYGVSADTDGSTKTRFELMVSGEIVADFVVLRLAVGLEGKVEFTVDGAEPNPMELIRRGLTEIARWQYAKQLGQKAGPAFAEARRGVSQLVQHRAEQARILRDDLAWLSGFSGAAMEHHSFKEREQKLASSFRRRGGLMNIVTDEAERSLSGLRWLRYWVDSDTFFWKGNANNRGMETLRLQSISNLLQRRRYSEALVQLEHIESVSVAGVVEYANSVLETAQGQEMTSNDPDVGFKAALALKASAAAKVSNSASGKIEVKAVDFIEDKLGAESFDLEEKSAKLVSLEVTIGGHKAKVTCQWTGDDRFDVTVAHTSTTKDTPPRPGDDAPGKDTLMGLYGAVTGGAGQLALLSDPVAMAKRAGEHVGDLIAAQVQRPTKPGSVSAETSRTVTASLSFKKPSGEDASYALAGGKLKLAWKVGEIKVGGELGEAGGSKSPAQLSANRTVTLELSW